MDPVTIIAAINGIRALTELVITTSGAADKVATLLTRARTENREISLDEWNGLVGSREEALNALQAAIDARKALGEV